MYFSREQVEHFKQHGYVVAPEFWSPREIEAMRVELERLKREGLLRNVTTEGDGKTHSTVRQNLQLCPMYNRSNLFRAMHFAPQLIQAVGDLIGDPVVFHLDQVFLKPGRQGAGTNWHQDNAYFKMNDPLTGTAAWTAVHDATIANGAMHVIPDAFREAFPHERDGESDHHIRCYPAEDRAVPLELKAGGVIFFCYGTPHCTKANTTEHERAGVALHFHNGNYSAECGLPPERRELLSGPGATDGTPQYGVRVAGAWDAEVERALLSQSKT